MKAERFLSLFAGSLAILVCAGLASCSEGADLSEVWATVNDHEKRLSELEKVCEKLNDNIKSSSVVLDAMLQNDQVVSVSPVKQGGDIVAYVLNFAKAGSITVNVFNGSGTAVGCPKIGLRQDEDGIWYWTLDGEWLLDDGGSKVRAS